MVTRRLERLPVRLLEGDLRLFEAATFRARLIGLAGLEHLPRGQALVLPRTRAVHTFGMRFALDLVFLDADGRPLRVAHAVPPRRARACARARAVIEAPAGEGNRFARVAGAH